MLVLSRKPQERVVISSGITVSVLEIQERRVRLGITPPPGGEPLELDAEAVADDPEAGLGRPEIINQGGEQMVVLAPRAGAGVVINGDTKEVPILVPFAS